VPRLSILIPFAGDVEPFETTLASVLQNRPEGCEVLVAHAGRYQDPYELESEEVQFLEQPASSGVVELINSGIDAAAGEVLHILRCGAEVEEGWTAPALTRFEDEFVALVSPLLLEGENQGRIVACGVNYGIGGSRKLAGARSTVSERKLKKVQVLGPTLAAGFYRLEALRALGGFDASIGDEHADIDAALTLQAIGCKCQFEAASRVRFTDAKANAPETFRTGRQSERLFWRHQKRRGGIGALLMHPLSVLVQALGDLPHPGSVTQLLGRTIAGMEFGTGRRQEERLQAATDAYFANETVTLPMVTKSSSSNSQATATRRAA